MLTLLRCTVLWGALHVLVPTRLLASVAQDDTTTSWQQYVRAPPSSAVAAKAVLDQYTTGNVTNSQGIITGAAPANLTRPSNTSDAPSVVIDFGQDVVGYLTIKFAGAATLAQGYPGLRLAYSETLEYLTDRSDYTRSDRGDTIVFNGTDQVAVQSQPYTWVNQWGCQNGTQVCSDGTHGFRYVKITLDALPADSPITASEGYVAIESVGLQWLGYLGTPDTFTGWFECSDAEVTQWWYDGVYTTDMGISEFGEHDIEPREANSSSLLGKTVLLDGAKRDRDPYVGDLAVSSLVAYLSHSEQTSTLNVMIDVIEHQRSDGWIPPASIQNYTLELFDYPLWWVSCSWDYVYYTGNVSFVSDFYPNLKLVLDTYYPANTAPDSSLLLRPNSYGDYAFLSRPGSAAYFSALYVLALRRAASLADLISQPSDAASWRARAANVSDAFVSSLWDPTVGAFLDRNCTGETSCSAHAQDGNSLAILSGIVAANSSQATSALAYLSAANARPYGNAFYDAAGDGVCGLGSCSQIVYAFVSAFENAARFEAGDAASALDQLRRTYGAMAAGPPADVAANVVEHPGLGTFWEGIGPDGVPYEAGTTSMAHGWSAGVVPLLTTYVLGVRPVAPGFAQWVLAPALGNDTALAWARGAVPTPYGAINVSWSAAQATDGSDGVVGIGLCVSAPSQTSGTVMLPTSKLGAGNVTINGDVVWDGSNGNVTVGAAYGAEVVDGSLRVAVGGDANIPATGC